MRTFKDNQGQQWDIALNLRKVRECRDRLGIDLLHPEQYLGILTSLTDRLALVFILCEDQAKELEIDVDDFEERLYGDGFADQASIAMLGESEVFFQKLGQKASEILARKAIESLKAGQERLQQMIQSGELERSLEDAQKEMEKATPKKSPTTAGAGSPNSAQSAD